MRCRCTLTRKNMNLPYSICMHVLNEFLTADRSCTSRYFWKTLIEVGSSHIYASFGTFWVKIGQLFEAQWVFEKCLKTVKWRQFRILPKVLNLTVPRIIDQFEPKRCQKKRKYVSYQLLSKFFQKICCTWTVGCQKFVQYISME